MTERHLYTNRLIKEKSPYLLQHAHNPVDWYPWGEEAFKAAREQDKPIFLSIGYATCHWCHVMEKESFENLEVAQLLNETFINIKVDREELPEIDSLYMEFAQSMMSGAAGWPLNLILTPNLEPFFASTYLPPYPRHGLMGITDLVHRIKEVWEGEERDRIVGQAERIVEIFQDNVHLRGDDLPIKETVNDTADLLFKIMDPVYGGLKGHPKFPIGYQNNFFLRYSSLHQDSRALFIVEKTLDMMQRGGIYDHLEGGFSRYSVDERWLVPHFEKMLYDNALLSFAYLETWKATKKNFYRTVCCEILDYVLRDMTHPEGGFYSAEDADSEGHEGYYYTWTWDEVQSLLGNSEKFDLFCEFYDISSVGNFEGRNILNTKHRIEEFAATHHLDPHELEVEFNRCKDILKTARRKRQRPFKDDKILTSWNGLMIFSMIEAGNAFNELRYIQAAEKAAYFIKNHLWKDGVLYRRWREGETHFTGGLDEHAFLIRALISLFESSGKTEWLAWAIQLTSILEQEFKAEGGAYFQGNGKDPSIILRKCHFSDGAEPSGNAIHTENLLRLHQLTLDFNYLSQAEDVLRAVKQYLDQYSPAYIYHVMNIQRYYDRQAPTIVVALNHSSTHQEEIRKLLFETFIPHRAIVWRRDDDAELFKLLPFVAQQKPIDNQTTLYICHEGVCKVPLTDLNEMQKALS